MSAFDTALLVVFGLALLFALFKIASLSVQLDMQHGELDEIKKDNSELRKRNLELTSMVLRLEDRHAPHASGTFSRLGAVTLSECVDCELEIWAAVGATPRCPSCTNKKTLS